MVPPSPCSVALASRVTVLPMWVRMAWGMASPSTRNDGLTPPCQSPPTRIVPPPSAPVASTRVPLSRLMSSLVSVTRPPRPRRELALRLLLVRMAWLGGAGTVGASGAAGEAGLSLPPPKASSAATLLARVAARLSLSCGPRSSMLPPALTPVALSCAPSMWLWLATRRMVPPCPWPLASSVPPSCNCVARKVSAPPGASAPSPRTETRAPAVWVQLPPLVSVTCPPALRVPWASITPSLRRLCVAAMPMRPPSSPLARMAPVLTNSLAAIWMSPPLRGSVPTAAGTAEASMLPLLWTMSALSRILPPTRVAALAWRLPLLLMTACCSAPMARALMKTVPSSALTSCLLSTRAL